MSDAFVRSTVFFGVNWRTKMTDEQWKKVMKQWKEPKRLPPLNKLKLKPFLVSLSNEEKVTFTRDLTNISTPNSKIFIVTECPVSALLESDWDMRPEVKSLWIGAMQAWVNKTIWCMTDEIGEKYVYLMGLFQNREDYPYLLGRFKLDSPLYKLIYSSFCKFLKETKHGRTKDL